MLDRHLEKSNVSSQERKTCIERLGYFSNDQPASPEDIVEENPSKEKDSSPESSSSESVSQAPKQYGYFIAFTRRTKQRKLHFEGRCNAAAVCMTLAPWGTSRPPTSEFDSVCKACWPSTESTSEASSSSSTSI